MRSFNPFVENDGEAEEYQEDSAFREPKYAARIAVYDDMSMPPHVTVIDPKDTRTYLQEIVDAVYSLMKQQGGEFSYQAIREIVENYIHAQFIEPIISILDHGQTLIFSDQGPGIPDKENAIKPSFTSATSEMKRYIRGTGSGLPIVNDYIKGKGGTLTIQDNLGHGTIVTLSVKDTAGKGKAQEVAQTGGVGSAGQDQQPLSAGTCGANGSYGGTVGTYGFYGTYGAYAPFGQGQAGFPQQGSPQALAGMGYPYSQPQPGYPQAAQQGLAPVQATYPQQTFDQGYPPGQATFQQYAGSPYPAVGQVGVPYPGAQTGALGAFPPLAGPQPQGTQPQGTRLAGAQAQGVSRTSPLSGTLDEKGRAILALFTEQPYVGPSLINRRLGISPATASRRLKALMKMGLAVKKGQQYVLTEAGAKLLSQLHDDGTNK